MTPTCPYCRTPFEPEDEVIACPACGTQHHADCAEENGGCTVFGCSKAPVEEPKISVTPTEIARPSTAANSAPPPPGRRVPLPPPPRPADWVAPPPRPHDPVIRTGPLHTEPLIGFAGYTTAETPNNFPTMYTVRKSRVVYVLLAVFFGVFGVHNFYAGYIKKAVTQLCITLFTCFYAAIIVWIFAIIEACIVSRDEDGISFT